MSKNNIRDDDGLILTKRDPSKRKDGVVWEGVYKHTDTTYRSQFQFDGVTLNLGEYDTARQGAERYTLFSDNVGWVLRENYSGINFREVLEKYLPDELKNQIDRAVANHKGIPFKPFKCREDKDLQTLILSAFKTRELPTPKGEKQLTKLMNVRRLFWKRHSTIPFATEAAACEYIVESYMN